jgi:heme-degrading monooxygenase HmoA
MIIEIAHIDITPGSEALFEAAVEESAPLFEAAKGCHGVRLQRGVERRSHYVLVVEWETMEDHMVIFRGSPTFARWRELVGPYFAAPPQMEHVQTVVSIN